MKNTAQLSSYLIVIAVFLVSCAPEKTHPNHPDWPTHLTMAYLPDEEQPGRRLSMYESLETYLEEQLNLEVNVVKTTLYGPVVEAMISEKIDIAYFSAFSYLIASSKGAAESLVMRQGPDLKPRVYYSHIVVHSDSDIYSIDNLVSKGKELTFSFVNPASTSGHLIPRAHLEREGIVPEGTFKEMVYSGSQHGTIYSLLGKKVDAAAFGSANLKKAIRSGRIDPKEFRIIWTSPAIPAGCTAARKNLPESFKEAVKTAFIEMETQSPETFELIQSIYREYLDEGEEPGGYTLCPDSVFDPLRNLTKSIKQLNML